MCGGNWGIMTNVIWGTGEPSRRRARWAALAAIAVLIAAAFIAFEPAARSVAASPCGPNINAIACENQQPGTSPSEWDIVGAGDPSIQGFATDISVNAGQRVDFKIDTDASDYSIRIYRTGWYQGLGARYITTVNPSAPLPQDQPECVSDVATELYDCGTWGVSASWNVPADAVSGIYIARLIREDTGGDSHILFIVRNDGNTSDVLFQTSDPTWHAYNTYGGADFYQGAANGRAYKISYNRPFATREGVEKRDFYFSSEYATVRFLERNGYDVSYIAGVDTARRGQELLNHNVFLSVGHDEYWSGEQRANIEAARDVGVNLQFLTGNEGYWRTRYEPSADSSKTPYRTLVSYKETWGNAANRGGGKIDTSSPEWTGTWRDPRFADASQGGHSPENALTGTMYFVNHDDLAVTVSAEEGKLRLWRNTGLGSTQTQLAPHTVGYESNEVSDNGFSPPGLIKLSTTVGPTPQYLTDYGNSVVEGTTTHHLTLYRAASGALVFSAGSVQWSWGLDETHDGDGAPADRRMQQAQVNLLADMGAQPTTLMPELVAATASSDVVAPTTTITSPSEGASVANGQLITVTGSAADVGGRVAGVEVSTDGGERWHAAAGTDSWSYSYVQQGLGTATILARAIDDSGNFSSTGVSRNVTVTGPASIFGAAVPAIASTDDDGAYELGLRFSPDSDGAILGVRFYKGTQNTGTHTGSLWDADGTRLASVIFENETATGWQTAMFPTPVDVVAGLTYTVSYTAPKGGYALDLWHWPYKSLASTPLNVANAIGSAAPGVFGSAGGFPTSTYQDSNYYVDALFAPADAVPLRLASRTPVDGATAVALDAPVTVTFNRPVLADSVAITVTDPDGRPVDGTVSYDAATRTARFAPAVPYAPLTSYLAVAAAADSSGASLDDAGARFTTHERELPEGECPCTLFRPSTTPTVASAGDTASVTLGVKFSVDVPGRITALRFFKGPENAGPHTGALWRANGTRLADVTFNDEPATGWVVAQLSTPIEVTPGETYVASYRAPHGGYSVNAGQFGASGYVRGPLSVPANGGSFTYAGDFPGESSTSNYLVDVVFERSVQAPTATAMTPAPGALDVAPDTKIDVTFDLAVQNVYTGRVTAGGTTVAGSWSRSGDGRTLSFSPAQPLPGGAAVNVALTGIVGTNGVPGQDVAWQFGVRAPDGDVVTSLFADTTPAVVAETGDTASVELGLAFRTSVPGEVRAIRFYKASTNTGTHTGSIWASDGRRLAMVTFENESASGWQRAVLSQPVILTPDQIYVVSYLAPRGNYSYTSAALNQSVSRGPLTTVAVENGRYRYGSGGTMPSQVWNATNYFVDVEFVAQSAAGDPLGVVSTTPERNESAAPVDRPVEAVVQGVGADQTPKLSLTLDGETVAGTTTYTRTGSTVAFRPAADLAYSRTYVATVTVNGAVLDTWSFRTEAAPPMGSFTVFSDETPQVPSVTETAPVELGTAFSVTTEGTATALRFYQGPGNEGPHRGTLWDQDGSILARVDFAVTSASGWQTAALAQPVTLVHGRTYVVSYYSPNGKYSYSAGYFQQERVNGPVVAPAGPNGRFFYGVGGGFPVDSWQSTGYFVDAVVDYSSGGTTQTSPTPAPAPTQTPTPSPTPTPAPALPPVTVTAATPAPGAVEVTPTSTVTAALDSTPESASLSLTRPDASAVAGTSAFDPESRTLSFVPAEPLDWKTAYTAVVTVPGRDVTAGSWTFTTAEEPPTVSVATIFGDALPQHPSWDDPVGVQVATRFSVSQAGEADGVRFYKGDANTGAHTGYLWRADGTKLAEVEFIGETAEGWQTARFLEPVQLEPGIEYRVGLYSTTGRYAVDLGGLENETATGVFTVPPHGSSYGYSRDFPAETGIHNYWVDILYTPAP